MVLLERQGLIQQASKHFWLEFDILELPSLGKCCNSLIYTVTLSQSIYNKDGGAARSHRDVVQRVQGSKFTRERSCEKLTHLSLLL